MDYPSRFRSSRVTSLSDHSEHIKGRIKISEEEIEKWQEVGCKMFVPIMSNGLVEQFEGYEKLEEFPALHDGKIDSSELKRC